MASEDRKPIFVVGSINADIVVEVEKLPLPGETMSASGGGQVIPGGKGANQAAAAALLGYPTFMVGQVGDDSHGTMLTDALKGAGVQGKHVEVTKGPSGQAIILLQPSGENSIIILGGANRTWSTPSPEALEGLETAGAVLLQREVPYEVNLKAAEVAKGAGALVCLDAGGDADPIPADLLKAISILSPNETELARLTGKPTKTLQQCIKAADVLIKEGVAQVLVKRGEHGSVLVGGDLPEPLVQEAITLGTVVDTTAAGDSFTAAYVAAILEGNKPKAALELASAAASLSVEKLGAIPSLPSFADTNTRLHDWRHRNDDKEDAAPELADPPTKRAKRG